ncbi:sigma-70 family RNA polymerase sigma factor [Aquimarina sp. TRL1]|uniref:RNA polymerase sigma factor n=1 Tax=Aquimarina sp. (strain TRL1) TaxID=2736252 RepID=UPI00158949C8|nr:sigma-70 family RNA polymerase sigma factor [Aquimarina sp. TRL1]QKX05904.1 sigma-70 family RNA polymerase sigma factor [Aquimarina sp. TRL1]
MTKKKPHSDQRYIHGLLNNDHRVVAEIYEKFAPKIRGYVRKNSGDDEAANDLIQETLLTIYHQGKEKELVLTCPFDAYFFLLCKRRWLNTLKKTTSREVTMPEDFVSVDEESIRLAEETAMYMNRKKLYDEMFEKLGDSCKELLKLSFAIKSMEEVANKLGKSYGYVRKRKSICIGRLTKMIQESPMYKKIKEGL